MNSPQPTVFVVDDDPAVLKAISRLLRSAGFDVRIFNSSQEFLDHHDPAAHGCVVLDVAMPGLTGLELQQALAAMGVCLPIIFLTGHGDIPMGVNAMKQGAVDFLTKPVDETNLVKAISTAISRDQAAQLARTEVAEIRRRLATLTPREYEVLEHVVSGKPNKETAAELGTAEKTIKVHRGRVMEKMKVKSLAELVHIAERVGISAFAPTMPVQLLDPSSTRL